LVDALKSSHPELRESAAVALGRVGAFATRGLLIEAANDRIVQVRQAALVGLGLMHDSRNVGLLAETLADRNKPMADRQFAALGLGLSGRNEAATFLMQQLKGDLTPEKILIGDNDLLLAMVWAAGLFPDHGFTTLFVEACQKLEGGAARDSRRLRIFLIQALGNMGDPIAAAFLVGQSASRDFEIQRAAVQALGRLRSPMGAIPALLTQVNDSKDTETRLFSILAIGRIGGDEAIQALKGMLDGIRRHRQLHAAWGLAVGFAQSEELHKLLASEFVSRKPIEDVLKIEGKIRRDEERLRGAFALGLGFYGQEEDEVLLLKVIRQQGLAPDFVGYISNGLGLLDGLAATEHLFALANRNKLPAEAQRGVAWGLGFCTHPLAGEQLVGLISRANDAEVRWAAAHALSEVRTKKALDALVTLLADVGEPEVDSSRYSHFIMALGHLGDTRNGDGIGALLAGLNYRLDFPLLRAVRAF
ncbi:MAG: HEAT repeat domain-containing protein, partial [Planctomycetes bacterium]|nr:HEAT repeat domain-containing protein [Planctomycetota bacterium]